MRLRSAALALALVLPLGFAACSRRPGSSPGPRAGAPAALPPASLSPGVSGVGVVAEVDGAPILESELDEKASGRMARLRQEEYEIKKQTLDEIVAERLLDAEAAKRGVSREELLHREVEAKTPPVPLSALEGVYEQNKTRFAGQPKTQALERIREVLERRSRAERRQAFEQDLRARAKVSVRLSAPRTQVALPAWAPATGRAGAPVSIVEFTDYQCPFCHRAQGVMDQVLTDYAGKVRLVHLDFPLEGHPGAIPAAKGARCAGEQGKFWPYHHDLMTVPGPLDDGDLKGRAAKLGLRAEPFAACLASGRYDTAIHADLEEGEALGVTGTPAYFVNGRMLTGARPFEEFKQVIDAEFAGR